MANTALRLNEDAPQETVTFSLASENIELAPGDVFETSNDDVVSNALVHPWLDVEVPQAETYVSKSHQTLAPEDDALTQEGQLIDPNDPDEIRKAEEAKEHVTPGIVAPAVEVAETTEDTESFDFGFGDQS